MSKKSIRKVHIGDDIWWYVIDYNREPWTEPTSLRIYEPNKKMHRITHLDLETAPRIQPSHIKNYILKNLIQ